MDPGREVELKLGQGFTVRASYAEMLKRMAIHAALNGAAADGNVPVDDLVIEEKSKPPAIKLPPPLNRKQRREAARRRRRRSG